MCEGRSRFSLKDLFIGSEGLWESSLSFVAFGSTSQARKQWLSSKNDAAAQTVSDIVAASIIPCTLEFLDKTTIACVESYARIGLPLDCEAILLMETDGHSAIVSKRRKMCKIAKKMVV